MSLCGEGLGNRSVVVLMIEKKSRVLVKVFSMGLSLGRYFIFPLN
jgi:hypothetical protein